MQKIRRPEGDNPDTPLEFYIQQPNVYYMDYVIEGIEIVQCIHRKTDDLENLEMKITELLTPLMLDIESSREIPPLSDLKLIESALVIVDFIVENTEVISRHYFIVADMISIVLMLINKISDVVKNRNLHIAPESGWWLFDLLAKLSINIFKDNQPIAEQLNEHETLKHFMIPKIIHEDLSKIQKILQQMHDTEAKKYKINSANKKFQIFNSKPEILNKIAKLQDSIEEGIACSKDVDKFQKQLTKIVADNQLQANVEHIRFFCTSVNNYHSLKKLISIIENSQSIKNLSTREARQALLYILVQIGEYMTHKKLTNKFREAYPGIPWDNFQFIRDCIEHPEERQRYEIIENLLTVRLHGEEDFLKIIYQELNSLKEALEKLLILEYSDPNEKFMAEYLLRYEVKFIEEEKHITDNEIQFFMGQLDKKEPELIKHWQAILNNNKVLPSNKQELAKLTNLIPKGIDINKERRLECESIINKLGAVTKIISQNEKDYLLENLEITSENREKVEIILAQIGQKNITKTDKNILRNCLPKKQLGQNEENIKRCYRIVGKLEDIRDQGDCILFPSERKRFEETSLYQKLPEKWTKIILKKQLPSVEDMELIISGEVIIDQNVSRKIQQYFYLGIKARWLRKLKPTELDNLQTLLEKYSPLKWKWLKILNGEIAYPDPKTFTADMLSIDMLSKDDAKRFIEITMKLMPIKVELPAIQNLVKQFNISSNEKLTKTQLINIAIACIREIDKLTTKYIYDKKFILQLIEDIIMPEASMIVNEARQNDPAYREFFKKREAIMQKVYLEAMLTGKEILVPQQKIKKLYKEICGDKAYYENSKSYNEFMANLPSKMYEAHTKKYNDELPRLLEVDAIFRNAIVLNLTISLALLKKIMKLPEARVAGFLKENYIQLKKARNELTHGDYIRESLNKSSNETIEALTILISHILEDFNKIKSCIVEAWPKAWAQISIAMMLHKTGSLIKYKPAVNALISEITQLAFPNSITSSEKNGSFNHKIGFAGKFFHTLGAKGLRHKIRQQLDNNPATDDFSIDKVNQLKA